MPYTAQKMVPRDSSSKTAVQLKADYEKAVSGQGVEAVYDEPSLAIYETVEMAMTSNPAYGSYGVGAAAAIDTDVEHAPSSLPFVKHKGSHEMHVASNWRPSSQEVILTKSVVTTALPLPDAPAISSVSRKHPHSSQVPWEVNPRSVPRPQDVSHAKVAVKLPIADPPLKKLPCEQHPEADAQSQKAMSRERNVAFLKSLGVDTVQRLLSGMNLSEHRERFRAEHVDGEILACCDVQSLQELGVTSGLQRIRFTKLIDGTHSASMFLNK